MNKGLRSPNRLKKQHLRDQKRRSAPDASYKELVP
jgi:hypothetical protein